MTVSKITAGLATALFIVMLRYVIHGGLILNPLDLKEGLGLGAIGVLFRLAVEGVIRGHLEPMGINYNLNQVLTGLDKPHGFYMRPIPS